MCQISIEIPDAVLYGTNMNLAETTSFARKALSMEYYLSDEVIKMALSTAGEISQTEQS